MFEKITVSTAERIITMTEAMPTAKAVAVADGRIVSEHMTVRFEILGVGYGGGCGMGGDENTDQLEIGFIYPSSKCQGLKPQAW